MRIFSISLAVTTRVVTKMYSEFRCVALVYSPAANGFGIKQKEILHLASNVVTNEQKAFVKRSFKRNIVNSPGLLNAPNQHAQLNTST